MNLRGYWNKIMSTGGILTGVVVCGIGYTTLLFKAAERNNVTYVRQASAENRSVSRQSQSTNNPDFASLLKRLDKDGNGVTTVEEIVEGFGEVAEKKGVYHHEYSFTLPDGSRQSLLIDLDYRER